MKIIETKNIEDLERFLAAAGGSLSSFRYFESRPHTIINQQMVTLLGYENGSPIAYGHLEKEGDKVWLGICVADDNRGKGYGKKVMDELIRLSIEKDVETIHLSVYADNLPAIKMYEKYGFKANGEGKNGSVLFYRRDR